MKLIKIGSQDAELDGNFVIYNGDIENWAAIIKLEDKWYCQTNSRSTNALLPMKLEDIEELFQDDRVTEIIQFIKHTK